MLTIILLLILLFSLNSINIEHFQNNNMYPTRLLGMARHVRLNKFNRIDAVYIKAPLPKTGESRCDVVVCPDWIPDNSICYKCK